MDTAQLKLSAEIKDALTASFNSEEVKKLVEETKASDDNDNGTFKVVASTEDIDRFNEVIKQSGWELAHFLANPVILWGHSHFDLPIGIATSVRVMTEPKNQLEISGKFASHPFAQMVRKLFDEGVVKATSVGFLELEREGNIITKAELLELSFVTVPANPFALAVSKKLDMDFAELVTKGIFSEMKYKETEIPPADDKPKNTDDEPTDPATDDKPVDPAPDAPAVDPPADDDQTPKGGDGDDEPEEIKSFGIVEDLKQLQVIMADDKIKIFKFSDESFEQNVQELSTALQIVKSKENIIKLFNALKDMIGEKDTGDEPQGDETPSDPDGDKPDGEDKAVDEILFERKLLQIASTAISEKLGDLRTIAQEHYKANHS